MGILATLSKLLHRRSKEEAIQSPLQSLQSPIQSPKEYDSIASIASSTFESSSSPKHFLPAKRFDEPPISYEPPKPTPQIHQESLQLGLAAGYTGRFIKSIEQALSRIEYQMVTKDWFKNEFEDTTPELINLIKQHDKNVQQRFDSIQQTIDRMYQATGKAPEPLRSELIQEIRSIEKQIPLSPKMRELMNIVKEAGEISYADIASRLEISISGLRGLLSNTLKRTNKLKRFDRNGKGWIKYID